MKISISYGCDSTCRMSNFGFKLCMLRCITLRPLFKRCAYDSVDTEDESAVSMFGPG